MLSCEEGADRCQARPLPSGAPRESVGTLRRANAHFDVRLQIRRAEALTAAVVFDAGDPASFHSLVQRLCRDSERSGGRLRVQHCEERSRKFVPRCAIVRPLPCAQQALLRPSVDVPELFEPLARPCATSTSHPMREPDLVLVQALFSRRQPVCEGRGGPRRCPLHEFESLAAFLLKRDVQARQRRSSHARVRGPVPPRRVSREVFEGGYGC